MEPFVLKRFFRCQSAVWVMQIADEEGHSLEENECASDTIPVNGLYN